MKLEKCPVCAKKMKESNGRMICPECGYYQIVDRDAASVSTAPVSAPVPNPGSAPRNHSAGPTSAPSSRPLPPLPQQLVTVSTRTPVGTTSKVVIISCIALIAAAFIVYMIPYFFSKVPNESPASAPEAESVQDAVSASDTVQKLPESEFFQSLISEIFGKDYMEVSPEQLRKVTELSFYYDDDNRKCIYCLLDDETEKYYYIDGNLYPDFADLSCFPGVTALSLEYGSVYPGDLDGMESLTYIASDMALAQLSEIVPNPEAMQYIEINSTIFMSTCDGIENFPNLISLSIDSSSLTDISALADAADLKMLALSGCDRLDDFSPLYEMGQLEALALDCASLKEIGFVADMPNLYYLSIEDAEDLISIEALEARSDTLEQLYLEDTWGLHDFGVVERLSNLNALQLFLSYGDTLPSFANLPSLEYLKISGAGDISALADATGLVTLSLDGCNCEDLSFLSNFSQLQALELLDMSGYFIPLEPVASLPALAYLDISGTTAYTDVTPLLGIPSLQEFYMNECNIGLDVDHVPYNETLTVLNMNDVSLYSITETNGWLEDEKIFSLSEHTDIFANFPSLVELYVADSSLEDLSFITEDGLENLELLDITDNYVTDLSPLSDLANLYTVKCEDNPIVNTAGLDGLLVR